MSQEPEWVSIAEAARALGLAERQARRWAQRLPAADRRQEDVTPGRSRALVNLTALRALVADPAAPGATEHLSGQVSGQVSVPASAAYERIHQTQQARIDDLQAALEHERRQNQQLIEALRAEQHLRALAAPEPPAAPPSPLSKFLAWLRSGSTPKT